MQIKMDVQNFCTKMETKHKITKIAGVPRVVDSLALFKRLILISARQGYIADSFSFELTPMPLSSFDQGQNMRKAQKSALGRHLKSFDTAGSLVQPQNPSLVIDAGTGCCTNVHTNRVKHLGRLG